MAKINDTSIFPITAPALDDLLLGTDVSDTSNDANGETVNFELADVQDLIAKPLDVGVDQSWAVVARSIGTSYQNTSGGPIGVFFNIAGASAAETSNSQTFQVSANGSTWVTVVTAGPNTSKEGFVVLPNTHYYRITLTGTGGAATFSVLELA